MGWDHSLSCKECRERLNIARNSKLYREKDAIDLLEKFLIKHADHDLIFDGDDNWSRVPGCTIFKE